MNLNELEINIEGYSGPFDLLCSLAEDKKFQLTGIKISQLIRIYGLYLIKSQQAPAETLAEFFYMTSGLLLEKTRSLLPGYKESDDKPETSEHEEKFMRTLERYMPYRKAYLWLAEKFAAQSKLFRRDNQEVKQNMNQQTEIIIAPESAELIAEAWKIIHDKQSTAERNEQELYEQAEENADWNGFAELDIKQIDERVSELEDMLNTKHSLSFHALCCDSSRHIIVITLLAMLELCRMGKATIEQDELFSDVRIITKT